MYIYTNICSKRSSQTASQARNAHDISPSLFYMTNKNHKQMLACSTIHYSYIVDFIIKQNKILLKNKQHIRAHAVYLSIR